MEIPREFLLPGDYCVTRKPKLFATLLGSCVSVCLRHKITGYAGMNHYMLSESPAAAVEDKGRYGNISTQLLIDVLFRIDPSPRNYTAKIYGGGAVVSHLGGSHDIGTNNIAIAREVLKNVEIPIIDEDVGGTRGRRINFNTATGEVSVREIKKTAEVERLASQRRDLASRDIRILVVDDSKLVRQILTQAINATDGFEVCGEAADPYEARDLVLSTNPDVLCLDIIMPRMSGLEFLKKLSKHYPLPVVICSTIAKAGSDIANRAREYGAVDVIDKEDLKLYGGMELVKAKLIPKLRGAVGKVQKKSLFAV
ncbi:MAG: response regulator [Planctomycetes bacterium]|nr:response regulator [Planctomycetota bacterium]